MINRLCIIGVGLIGGSFAMAVRAAGLVKEVVGVGRSEANLQQAVKLGVIDRWTHDAAEGVAGADLVMIAVPVRSTEATLAVIKDRLSDHCIVTDAGSAKGVVVEAARKVFGELPANFVAGHPIAGSEQSGVDAARVDLYQQHRVILTPTETTSAAALQTVTQLWQATGAEVVTMDVDHHDDVLAATSHLPHVLAYSLVDTLAKQNENQEIFKYAAGGFRDFTRIASSDPTMWRDIFLANKAAVINSLDNFSDGLAELRTALAAEDEAALVGICTRAKSARDHFNKMLSHTPYMETATPDNVTFVARAAEQPLAGAIRVAGDKSISHRSIMLGAIAEGVTQVEGFLEGEDSLATLQSFRDMGVAIEGPEQGKVTIYGVGLNGLSQPPGDLYLGNSGTSMRLLAGLLAGQNFDVCLTGDDSLSKRPMERVAKPLREMGAVVNGKDGKPPLQIKQSTGLKGIHYDMPVASAQVKSCLMLAGLYAEGETTVIEPAPTRDHTERMLQGFGYPVTVEQLDAQSRKITVRGGGQLQAAAIDVPADISSAAFFMVAASIVPGSNLLLQHVGMNPTRIGVMNILRAMGGDITLENERIVGGEPVADVRVRAAQLKGINIPEDQVPLAIDEFPVLFVAAACAEGQTVLTGAEELRVKESDRIQVMADGLKILGVDAQPQPDGIVIQGGPIGETGANPIASHGDHRIAMAFSVAALRASGPVVIENCANVATSFPNFVELANSVNMSVTVQN